MTYIEFFEKDAAENFCACLTKARQALEMKIYKAAARSV